MAQTTQNSRTVEESGPNGRTPLSVELLLTGLFIPMVALVMWYLGRLSNPGLTWNWNNYFMNVLYSAFFVLALRQAMSGVLKLTWEGWKDHTKMLMAAILVYVLLQSLVVFLIEKTSDPGTVGLVYGVGLVLTVSYVRLRVFLMGLKKQSAGKSNMLKAQQKGRTVYVSFEQTECLYTENKVTCAFAKGTVLLMTQSLTELEQSLPEQQFFRINRQFIVNKMAVDHFERQSNHTLELHLKTFPEQLSVSRAKTPGFITWVKEGV